MPEKKSFQYTRTPIYHVWSRDLDTSISYDIKTLSHAKKNGNAQKGVRTHFIDHEEFVVFESDVERVFSRVNRKKACGPDGMKGFVVSHCASQLSQIFTYIFKSVFKETHFTNNLENIRSNSCPKKDTRKRIK